MAPSKPLHVLYAQEFQNESLGYGLLHPCSSDRLHPGVCGYFDEEGDFRTIVDILQIEPGKPSALGDLQLSPLESTPSLPPPEVLHWEPKSSSDVSSSKNSGSGSVGPAETEKISDSFTFSNSSNFGAVLVSEAPVKLNYFSEDTPFRRWLKVNFQGLLRSFPHVFERAGPVWIITKTYSTSKCSVACWSGSQKDVSLEFGVKIAVEGEGVSAAPQGSKVRVKTTGAGWAHYGATEVVGCPLAIHAPPSPETDFVLFVGGIRFMANRGAFGTILSTGDFTILDQ